jgi:methenyltetrahydromethanopterin cyclohydrolase
MDDAELNPIKLYASMITALNEDTCDYAEYPARIRALAPVIATLDTQCPGWETSDDLTEAMNTEMRARGIVV